MTEFERIKAMSIEEMARFIAEKIMQQDSRKCLIEATPHVTATFISALNQQVFMNCLRWLESEVDTGDK